MTVGTIHTHTRVHTHARGANHKKLKVFLKRQNIRQVVKESHRRVDTVSCEILTSPPIYFPFCSQFYRPGLDLNPRFSWKKILRQQPDGRGLLGALMGEQGGETGKGGEVTQDALLSRFCYEQLRLIPP